MLIVFLFIFVLWALSFILNLLIYLISISVFTDTFPYLIDSLIWKHKMDPEITPKKSLEGFVAGLIGVKLFH